jgi:cystathionine beta-synthase
VVVGMGTGGTITGAGRYLKERNPDIQMIGVDPAGSILLEAWQRGHIPEDTQATTYKVEGIGEDFLPSTLDLSLIDSVLRVSDKESFLWTRRLVKEEGIFCGGSSGSAVAAAIRYARGLPAERLVVVILPDSGSRYLSKVFDDKWMRENGFLETEWSEITVGDVLARKSFRKLITANLKDGVVDVIALMKSHDISQVPVLDPRGSLAGLVTEVDLLKYMLESGQSPGADLTIAPIMEKAEAIFPENTLLEEVLPAIIDGYVILVTREERPVGILTKIDILDYIAQES